MTRTALIIGNSNYAEQQNLACCKADIVAVRQLLEATQKFDAIKMFADYEAGALKNAIRSSISPDTSYDEIFFYFTGHGYQNNEDFFYCASNFDPKRPHETGLGNAELHQLLKAGNAGLIVKIIDACSSGQLLVKSNGEFIQLEKEGFNNIVQIASCLDSQNSLTGDPLSLFTQKFLDAVLRPSGGAIYYSDIINALRDEFLNDNAQTPHFVTQGTGRDKFVSDATIFDHLRGQLQIDDKAEAMIEGDENTEAVRSISDSLSAIDSNFADQDRANSQISDLFAKLKDRPEYSNEYLDCYEISSVEHKDYVEENTRNFIVRVLAREDRPDKFVTAEIIREKKNQGLFSAAAAAASFGWATQGDQYAENFELELNCQVNAVQVKISLTPKFQSLSKIELIVSCAPSLNRCYVFEMLREHQLVNWSSYDTLGKQVDRNWYKLDWSENNDWIIEKIQKNLLNNIQEHINSKLAS